MRDRQFASCFVSEHHTERGVLRARCPPQRTAGSTSGAFRAPLSRCSGQARDRTGARGRVVASYGSGRMRRSARNRSENSSGLAPGAVGGEQRELATAFEEGRRSHSRWRARGTPLAMSQGSELMVSDATRPLRIYSGPLSMFGAGADEREDAQPASLARSDDQAIRGARRRGSEGRVPRSARPPGAGLPVNHQIRRPMITTPPATAIQTMGLKAASIARAVESSFQWRSVLTRTRARAGRPPRRARCRRSDRRARRSPRGRGSPWCTRGQARARGPCRAPGGSRRSPPRAGAPRSACRRGARGGQARGQTGAGAAWQTSSTCVRRDRARRHHLGAPSRSPTSRV